MVDPSAQTALRIGGDSLGNTHERVAVITHYFPIAEQPWRGHSAYQTVRALSKYVDVQVFATYPRYPRWFTTKHLPVRDIDKNYRPEGVRVQYLQYPAIPGISRFANARVAAATIEPFVRSYRPSVILSYWIYPDGGAAIRVGSRLGVPVVVKSIGSDLNRLNDPIVRACARSVLRRATLVTTVSDSLRRRALELGADPDRTVAILNGCDASIFHPADRVAARLSLNVPLDTELVTYVGSLDMTKGLGELVAAVSALAEKRPRLRAAIVGDGFAKGELETLIEARGLRGRIQMIAALPSAEVAPWIVASNLVALPSYSEGCPNIVVEALACGRAIVATNVGGIPELMDDRCGILVPPRDAAAFTSALDRALDTNFDEGLIAEHYSRSWDNVALDLIRLFEGLPRSNSNAQVAGASSR